MFARVHLDCRIFLYLYKKAMKKLLIISCTILFIGCSKESSFKSSIVGKWAWYDLHNAKNPSDNKLRPCFKDDIWDFNDTSLIIRHYGEKCAQLELDYPSKYSIINDTIYIKNHFDWDYYLIDKIDSKQMILWRSFNFTTSYPDTSYYLFQRQ